MAEQLPVAVADEDGTVTYSGVVLGAPGSEDKLVTLGVVKVEELTGGTVLDEPGQSEMVLSLDGKVYELEVVALKPPQGPTRKFILVGRLVRSAETPEAPEAPETPEGPSPKS